MRRRKGGYFQTEPDAPAPLVVRVPRRVSFSDVDPMGVLWHGRYAQYFELANEAIGRRCGLSYVDFRAARLRAPIVQFHVDYFASPVLGEEVSVVGRWFWNDGARLDLEYEIIKQDGVRAATGFTVQMFISDASAPLLASPDLLERCRTRWRAGEFREMQ